MPDRTDCLFQLVDDSQMPWNVSTPSELVEKELDDLRSDMRARFMRISELIEEWGPAKVRAPHVKHLDGPIGEMRMSGRDGISRALYVVCEEQRQVVVVRVFVKKTQKTPRREIRLARRRARELARSS